MVKALTTPKVYLETLFDAILFRDVVKRYSFAVIHETTRKRCERIISEISKKIGVTEYRSLDTKRELQETNPRYF